MQETFMIWFKTYNIENKNVIQQILRARNSKMRTDSNIYQNIVIVQAKLDFMGFTHLR